MNTNLLAVMQKLIKEHGEDILSNPKRIRVFLLDFANREPKAQRNAVIKCLEYGFYDKLKNTTELERPARKTGFVQRLHDEEGLDLGLCKDSAELLEMMLFGKISAPKPQPQAAAPKPQPVPPPQAAAPKPPPAPPPQQTPPPQPQAAATKPPPAPQPKSVPKTAPDPKIITAYINLGDSYYNQKDYDKAITKYTRVIQLDPNSSAAYRSRGAAYYSKGDYNQALANFSQAIQLSPDATIYILRGNVYSAWHDDTKALADYTEAIRLSPNLSTPYTARGLVYEKSGRKSQAVADYKKALTLNQNNTIAKTQLRKLKHPLRTFLITSIVIIVFITVIVPAIRWWFIVNSSPFPAAASATEQAALERFARIQGGTFMMGSPASETSRNSNELQHQVTVSSFYMGKYEVTQKEYAALMETNPSGFKGNDLPVEWVSWHDAVNYCNARSQSEGLTPAYTISGTNVTWNQNANGYRLPTEAEWEYACRAGTTTPFSTGSNITTDQANYDGNYPYNNNTRGSYREKTTAVGSFAPNPWGLYDMHGNVLEWCWDWYGAYSSGAQTDPSGVSSGSYRIIRGGSWYNNGTKMRSAYRAFSTPSNRGTNFGFRLVRSSL